MHDIKVKTEVINMINNMPEDVSLEDIIEELYFRIKIDKRLKDSEIENEISHETAGRKLSKWLMK